VGFAARHGADASPVRSIPEMGKFTLPRRFRGQNRAAFNPCLANGPNCGGDNK
jgi:hypothetical protein